MKASQATKMAAIVSKEPTGKAIFLFALPVLVGSIVQSLNGTVNAIWIGRYLGAAALAATANVHTLLYFVFGTILSIGTAATILVGQSLGSGNVEQCKKIVASSLTLFSLLAGAVTAFGLFFSSQILMWMHVPADVMPSALIYTRLIFLSVPFSVFSMFLMMILRGAGDTKTPFLFQLLAVCLDIVLNPLFIVGYGPISGQGIAGSAIASILAQGISVICFVVHIYSSKNPLCLYKKELEYLRPNMVILKLLIAKGLPMGLQMIVMSLSLVVMIALVNQFGSQTSAAYGACLQLWTYAQMPAMAVGMTISAIAAQYIGAKRLDYVAQTARIGVFLNFLFTSGLISIFYIFDKNILGLFLSDPAALALALHINAAVAWTFIFLGVSFVLSGVMRAYGAVLPPLIILFFALWCIRLPFAGLLMNTWGAEALWRSFAVGSFSAMLLSTLYYLFGNWRNTHSLMMALQKS